MSKVTKVWRLSAPQPDLQKQIAESLNISDKIAQILINRGMTNEYMAKTFLSGAERNLNDPYHLKDMTKAVQRIASAIKAKEKITIYGDYDVDGITATSLVITTLLRLGVAAENVSYHIPDRQTEGYGFHCAALSSILYTGCTLMISVDCGISAVNEINQFKDKMDIIVTDHHEPPIQLPPAYAIINPKQSNCSYPDKNLAGVGVAFKLCQALYLHYHIPEDSLFDNLDMVAIGTVADIVPLLGENRILVKLGLQQLNKTQNIGLLALLDKINLSQQQIDSGKIAFAIAPRLNAVGRIRHAKTGVELLLTKDRQHAQLLAELLEKENQERQRQEKEILEKVITEIDNTIDVHQEKVLVLYGEKWHVGVIGIVASRLVERYYKPTIVITTEEGLGKGSCRSIAGFNIYEALTECQDLLERYGGHPKAAGITIQTKNIDLLKQRLHAIAARVLSTEDYIPVLPIDSIIDLPEINSDFLEQIARLEPFGMGNPSPIFACNHALIDDIKRMGHENQHLKLRVAHHDFPKTGIDVVAWKMGSIAETIKAKECVDVAFCPEYNEWQGRRSIQLRAYDIRNLHGKIKLVYLILKSAAKAHMPISYTNGDIAKRINEQYQTNIAEPQIEVSIKTMEELGILRQEIQDDAIRFIFFNPTPPQKLNIEKSAVFRQNRWM